MLRQPLLLDQHEAFLQSTSGQGEPSNDDSSDESIAERTQQSKPFFPPAIIIRSQGTVPLAPNVLDPSLSPSRDVVTYPPKAQEWREWNINPAHHGLAAQRGPPVFVSSKGNYDELGRSVLDGSGVEVDMGVKTVREGRESGESVAGWYTALSRGRTPESAEVQMDFKGLNKAVVVPQDQAIDLTADSDEEEAQSSRKEKDELLVTTIVARGSSSSTLQSGPSSSSSTHPSNSVQPLRVRRDEWFIRRALLKSHQSAPPPPLNKSPGSSIGSMLGESPIQVKNVKSIPRYALGPDNKGYTILKESLGWGGGGLGKPAGWVDPTRTSSPGNGPEDRLDRSPVVEAECKRDEDNTIDLTVSSDESDESDLETTPPPSPPSGPGRTAPIATSLKLDRLGLGHRRNPRDHQGNLLKRVTHTHEQIERASRRKPPVEKLELGKKGKIKWKEKDRKEREERRRIAAFLNA